MKLKQIVISIENSPNRLYKVIKAMSEAGINLRALNLVDTGAFGQLRLLVSDVVKARKILSRLGILNTHWRWGTNFNTWVQSHSPNSTTRFWWQEGQKWRRLQE